MKLACSRRSFAALALATGLVLPVAASAAGPGAGRGHPTPTAGSTPTTGSHQRPSISPHQVSGILAEMPSFTPGPTGGPTLPAKLTVQQADGTKITVNVPTTTKLVRGYGGPSSLDEFAQGDRISAQGSFQTSTTFTARWIKDWSIQRAYSRVVGTIVSVPSPPNSLTLQVARGGSQHSPYQRSQTVTVDLTSSTLKIVSGTAKVGADKLRQGMRVLIMGVYNRTQSTLRATRVRILSRPSRHT